MLKMERSQKECGVTGIRGEYVLRRKEWSTILNKKRYNYPEFVNMELINNINKGRFGGVETIEAQLEPTGKKTGDEE